LKWLFAILLVIGLALRDCRSERSEPPQRVIVIQPNIYGQKQNKDLFDDFDGKLKLNWSILGLDTAHWSLDKVPGSLTVTTQMGSFEFARDNYKNVFLVDFAAEQSDDFQLTTCITNFKPSEIWNQAGLVLWNDKDNYFKFTYEYGEGPPPNNAKKLLFTAGREIAGRPNYGWFQAEQTPRDMWLRIIKRGEVYELYNSTDGKIFNPMNVILPARITKDNTVPRLSVPVKSIGIFTSNYTSTTAPEVDASFEFFEFKTLPPDPNKN